LGGGSGAFIRELGKPLIETYSIGNESNVTPECISPLDAKIFKPRHALYHQLPRAILLDLF
jgi:hypothetical protein